MCPSLSILHVVVAEGKTGNNVAHLGYLEACLRGFFGGGVLNVVPLSCPAPSIMTGQSLSI